MKCYQWISVPLVSVFALLIMGVPAIHAAYLKDIRVGEYDTYTRMVFELSEKTAFQRIISRNPAQLTVVFADTQPQLVRKIPLERTARVKDIKLLSRKDSLTLEFSFSFDHFRYELMEYYKPFRIIVDIYHLAASPATPPPETRPLKQPDAGTREKSIPSSQINGNEPSDAQPPATQTDKAPLKENQVHGPSAGEPAPQAALSAPSPQFPLQPPKTESRHAPPPAPDRADTSTSEIKGLQYYLVIGMVTMTIVILVLLLLMLIFKQPRIDNKGLNPKGDLRKHDKHIEAIDAKINEQLKRYEEA